jgi:hypothetical protein
MGQTPHKPIDLSSASKFGPIYPVFDVGDRPSLLPAQHMEKARKVLANFDEDEDFILWSGGDPSAPFMIGAILREMSIRNVTYLRWEKERGLDGKRNPRIGFYVPIKIPLS